MAPLAPLLEGPARRLLNLVGPGGIGKTLLALQSEWVLAVQGLPTPAEDEVVELERYSGSLSNSDWRQAGNSAPVAIPFFKKR